MLANLNPTHPDEIDANYRKTLLLEYLRSKWNVYQAAQKVGVERGQVYNAWMQDLDFKAKFQQTKDLHLDAMEEMTFSEGTHNKNAYVQRFFLLKAHRPEIYGDRAELGVTVTHRLDMGELASRTLQAVEAQYTIEADTQVLDNIGDKQ